MRLGLAICALGRHRDRRTDRCRSPLTTLSRISSATPDVATQQLEALATAGALSGYRDRRGLHGGTLVVHRTTTAHPRKCRDRPDDRRSQLWAAGPVAQATPDRLPGLVVGADAPALPELSRSRRDRSRPVGDRDDSRADRMELGTPEARCSRGDACGGAPRSRKKISRPRRARPDRPNLGRAQGCSSPAMVTHRQTTRECRGRRLFEPRGRDRARERHLLARGLGPLAGGRPQRPCPCSYVAASNESTDR